MDPAEQAQVEAAQRDSARFAPLYEAHFERIYAFVARRVRDRSAAEDVTAEVFRHALAAIGGFEWRGIPFASWLYRIAANEVADYMTRNARETGTPMPETAAASVSDDDAIEAAEQRASLFRLVGSLPLDQRRVIEMRFAQEQSIREIATAMGRSEGAVKQLQWRALQTLRSRMEPIHG